MQRRGHARFFDQAGRITQGIQGAVALDGDFAAQPAVPAFVHFAVSAGAQARENLIMLELGDVLRWAGDFGGVVFHIFPGTERRLRCRTAFQ
ncbi:hypothetical protein ASC94_26635 [Massilia sp. Root418]|nr:hypothetical protein ASC94_26635 [Massilia sp. Root418]